MATLARGGAAFALVLGLYFAASRTLFARLHVAGEGSGAPLLYIMDTALFLTLACLWLALRAEESRLARELRTARSGSEELRALVLRRRRQMPLLSRLCATRLGAAAVLLAEGDVEGARDELRANVLLARGGRLEWLRAVVEADEARASGTPAGVERCIQRLRELPASGNREADLYKTHVLVKAILQHGDPGQAEELYSALEKSPDEEARLYAVWLAVWFEGEEESGATYREAAALAENADLDEGDLRMATLLARAQGAEKLVERLEERLERTVTGSAHAIAEPGPRE